MKTANHILTGLAAVLLLAGCVTAQSQPDSRAVEKWIAQLYDSDYAKRNAAVQALSLYPDTAETALPLLKQELKQETDPNRCWWLKAAIQQCEENLPQPGEIYAAPDHSQGLQVNEACKSGDGPFTVVTHNGVRCWKLPNHSGNDWSYLYFIAGDAFRQKAERVLEIQLTYLDAGTGNIGLDYDSTDSRAAVNGAYENNSLTVHRLNSGQWRTVRFHIRDARFQGSENDGSDFRFSCLGDAFLVRSVRVWPVAVGG